MTPQERQLVVELFDRLAALENAPRDLDAERAIAAGLARAPHGTYALVQTAIIQDEALKRANARIAELEGQGAEPPRQGGFLDNMREALMGRDERRGSVPSVRPAAASTSGASAWAGGAPAPAGYGQPMMAQPMMAQPIGTGGSFLGTAAASAAGVIGGAMLLDGIRSMFGHSNVAGAYAPGLAPGATDSPWGGSAAGSDLARQAGIDNIGSAGGRDDDSSRAGFVGGGDVQPEDDGGYADGNDDVDLADGDIGGDGSDLA
ncbi:MAG TPA: DUF2076 domain-containing protein [Xanthobacteraceae bacterium]|jgi:uncharacterized protein